MFQFSVFIRQCNGELEGDIPIGRFTQLVCVKKEPVQHELHTPTSSMSSVYLFSNGQQSRIHHHILFCLNFKFLIIPSSS